MKKIWKLLQKHWLEDFQPIRYSVVGMFIAVIIAFNYATNFENGFIDLYTGRPIRIVWYFLLHSFTYYSVSFISLRSAGKLYLFRNTWYWIFTLSGLLILSVGLGFPYLTQVTHFFTDDIRIFSWAYKCASNAIGFLITALPLFILARACGIKDRFGVHRHQVDLLPYWQLLLLILPVVAMASFEPGFKNYYPSYKANQVAEFLAWPNYIPALIYELFYGLDFFNVEFIYRGFFVIGVSRIVGKEAILPMVASYCVLHFGKPMGEAISSVAGGYILGVVAYYTRNIWGGVMVHMGLAWMMELAAYLQKVI